MGTFLLKGKIIDENNKVATGLQVKAYEHYLAFLADHNIGRATTKPDGTFEIKFDESRFEEFRAVIERGPHVYLVIEYDAGKRLKTKVTRIEKEIEYHIKLVEDTPNPNAVDIYGDSMRRTTNMLSNVGTVLNNERINIDALVNGKLPKEIRHRFQSIRDSYDEVIKNFDSYQALLSGVVSATLQEHNLGTIGYDGPQAPRNAWREGGVDVIIWPRKEEFRWE